MYQSCMCVDNVCGYRWYEKMFIPLKIMPKIKQFTSRARFLGVGSSRMGVNKSPPNAQPTRYGGYF